MAGNQVEERMGEARPVSLPPVCCGTSGLRLGFPGLTAKAGKITQRLPNPQTSPGRKLVSLDSLHFIAPKALLNLQCVPFL